MGFDFGDLKKIEELNKKIESFEGHKFYACSLLNGEEVIDSYEDKFSPNNSGKKIGEVSYLSKKNLDNIAFKDNEWRKLSVDKRISILEKAAELLHENSDMFYALLISEAGKTLKDCDAEIREAIDFINYYNLHAEKTFTQLELESPSGERNFLSHGP